MASNPLSLLMDPASVGAGWQNAFQAGIERGHQMKAKELYADYVSNPSEDTARQIGRYDPELGAKTLQGERERQAAEQKAAVEKAQQSASQFARIAQWVEAQPNKEAAYQQALQAANSAGMDVRGAPPNYDQAWVQQNLAYAKMFLEKPQELSTLMQNVQASGYQPGTPEFQQQMRLQMDPTKTIPLTQGGGLATYTPGRGAQVVIAPNDGSYAVGTPVQKTQSQAGQVPEFRQTLTPQEFVTAFAYVPNVAEAAAKAGVVVKVASPDEARTLPSGTWIQMPDNTYGRVP